MSELEKFDQKICDTQKKYDELRAEYKTKKQKMRGLLDQLNDIKRETDVIFSGAKDSSQAKVI
jgi:peptidoglycan hydrolase CwlO-like protein